MIKMDDFSSFQDKINNEILSVTSALPQIDILMQVFPCSKRGRGRVRIIMIDENNSYHVKSFNFFLNHIKTKTVKK